MKVEGKSFALELALLLLFVFILVHEESLKTLPVSCQEGKGERGQMIL
jgi:hypothetical protein